MTDTQDYTASSQFWDQEAVTFDAEPDHGLRDSGVRQAWTEFLAAWLPPAPAAVLDPGCGTGSLSLVMAALGYQVTGIDFSAAMIAQAEAKARAADQRVTFHIMDADDPQLEERRFNAVICRHLLWTLPDPAQVLRRWSRLLLPPGRLILIEGFWHTGAGLHAPEVVAALPPGVELVRVENLSTHAALWGRSVQDERYAVIADLHTLTHPRQSQS